MENHFQPVHNTLTLVTENCDHTFHHRADAMVHKLLGHSDISAAVCDGIT